MSAVRTPNPHGELHEIQACTDACTDTNVSPTAAVNETVRTDPAQRVRFELRLQGAQLALWREMAKARGVTLADLLRDAVTAYATPEERAELERPAREQAAVMEDLATMFRALRGGVRTTSPAAARGGSDDTQEAQCSE